MASISEVPAAARRGTRGHEEAPWRRQTDFGRQRRRQDPKVIKDLTWKGRSSWEYAAGAPGFGTNIKIYKRVARMERSGNIEILKDNFFLGPALSASWKCSSGVDLRGDQGRGRSVGELA